MKKKFKKGDRVLVRNHDLEEWESAIFESLAERKEQSHPFIQFHPFIVKLLEGGEFWYTQCRHIDEYKVGDKVQVSHDGDNWVDATYLGTKRTFKNFPYLVETDDYDLVGYTYCRWHPSMPWVKKKSLTLEEKANQMWAKFKKQ